MIAAMDAAKAVGLGAALGVALLAAPGGQPGLPLDEGARVAHLLRRAGFGGSAEELAEYRALGLDGAVGRLVEYESVPDDVEEKLLLFYFDSARFYDVQRRWVLRMLWSRRPLQEKMVLFWHGLLTSANSKVGRPELMQRQNDFFRAHALDDYGTILKGISTPTPLDARTRTRTTPASCSSCSRPGSAHTASATSRRPRAPSPAGRCRRMASPSSTSRSSTRARSSSSARPSRRQTR
jgi:hypothetical protein